MKRGSTSVWWVGFLWEGEVKFCLLMLGIDLLWSMITIRKVVV